MIALCRAAATAPRSTCRRTNDGRQNDTRSVMLHRPTTRTAMSEVTTAYETDVVAWSREQAEALRAEASRSSHNRLDWANLAEEIESVGTSQRHELKSQIRRIIEHLLKLQYS